ncbi:SUMF1/EgtB/PvdO family nonheme iron enzyme, partial [Accumulibacter sp.]|uniref:sodium:solute symporter family transporter n=1 Tax=Accumulibacter sp. TaxID=2053492 RepID=UPI001AC1B2BD
TSLLETDSQLVLPTLVLQHTPLVAQAVFFGAVLSAVMSCSSATLLAPSVAFSENVVRGFFPAMGDHQFLRVMRISIVCFALIVLGFALHSSASIFKMVENAYKVTLAGAFVPLFFGAFWKRASAQGALAAIGGGLGAWILVELLIGEASPVPPQLIGLAVSMLGMVAGSLLPLRTIDAGRYPIGSDEGLYADESPAHTVELAAFAIACFPVSNAEWRLFIAAGGYDDERWWQGDAAQRWRRGEGTADGPKQQLRANRHWLGERPQRIAELLREGRVHSQQAEWWEDLVRMPDAEFEDLLAEWYPAGRQTQPEFWDDPAYNDASQPVVGVCWHEARAYCAWLSAQTGQLWRLPSEAEWEAAARGREGRRYAWGDEFDASRCNSFESHVRGTTPIGVFPDGDTPEGVVDLCGNVWEWTSSAYESYPYAPDARREGADSDARRVVRGGSWGGDRVNARCASRFGFIPGLRNDFLGLRLVCVSPILKR